MKPQSTLILSIALFIVAGPVTAQEESPPAPKPESRSDVTGEIKKLGGRVRVDKNGSVVEVGFFGTKVSDAGLEHLKGLTNLRFLFLDETKVTDAGLEHLKGLTNLQGPWLAKTKVTDTGLEHLEGLTKLRLLKLYETEVTGHGLEHLKGLTNLEACSSMEARSPTPG